MKILKNQILNLTNLQFIYFIFHVSMPLNRIRIIKNYIKIPSKYVLGSMPKGYFNKLFCKKSLIPHPWRNTLPFCYYRYTFWSRCSTI